MLDNEEDILHNPSNLQTRLRLKKCSKERIDSTAHSSDSNNECKINDSSTPQSPHEDNSILDFKSPKRIHSVLSKNIKSTRLLDKSKKKVSNTKIKIISNKKKIESSKPQNKKALHDAQQLSIESSFFKTENKTDSLQSLANVKTAYVCPLCFKNLKDESSQTIHMKNCAIKNHMSTKMLLNAVELQERQAAERKSLGLLSAPMLQDKKKPAPRKRTFHDDPDLELALALSKSLHEKEEIDEAIMLDEAGIMIESSNPLSSNSNKEFSHKTTLQSFGFTSDKNISPANNYSTSKTERRKFIEPTILQKRTAVEREHILTERITEILMGYKDFTQKVQEEKGPVEVKEKISIKRGLLQQLHQTENTLWDKTRLTSSRNVFYVTQLLPQITPLLKEEHKLSEKKNVVELTERNVDDKKSPDKEEIQEINEIQTANTDENITTSSSTSEANKEKRYYLNTLTTDWGNILNDSSASDIIIFVKENRHIWTHKLVFYVRCTNILLDVVLNDTVFSTAKEKIRWIDIDYDVALAFLEFIYCGIINRHSKILSSNSSLSAIRSLARKYKVKDLFVYLRQEEKSDLAKVEREHNTCEKSTGNANRNTEKASNISELSEAASKTSSNVHDSSKSIQYVEKEQLQEQNNSTVSSNNCIEIKDPSVPNGPCNERTASEKLSKQMDFRNNTPTSRSVSVSPDIFDDTPYVMRRNDKSATYPEDRDDLNIHVLLSLIKQDEDVDICSQKLSSRNSDNAEYSRLGETISARSIVEQNVNVREINSNLHTDSLKLPVDENSLIDTPQSSKTKTFQEQPLNITNQKSNLTLFIEKMQRANAKSDSNLDSDLDITIRPVKVTPVRRLNPFCTNEDNNSDNENPEFRDDDAKESVKMGKKLGGLSMLEQRVRSFADKNPEFYSLPSTERTPTTQETEQIDISPVPSASSEKSHYYNTKCYSQKAEQVTSSLCSPHSKTTNQLLSESINNLEANEEDISMFSKYMKNCCDNSIAKYRSSIRKEISSDNLSNSALSDLSNKDNDSNESDDDILTQSVLTQKDADVIISDTEIESISSSVSCPVVLEDDDVREDATFSKQEFGKMAKDDRQDLEAGGNNHSLEIEEILKAVTTDLKEENDNTTESKESQFNINDRETTSDAVEFNMLSVQTRSELNKLIQDKTNDREKFTPSPIILSSNPDSVNAENSLLDEEDCDERVKTVMRTENNESRGFAGSLINFEEEICLANVNLDRYEKYHTLRKSKSVNILNANEFKKSNARGRTITNSRGHIIAKDNNISNCGSSNNNTVSFKDSTDIRKFKKKYLSEGQIDINKLHNRRVAPVCENVPLQFECNYVRKNGNFKTGPIIIDKDVTPPRDYNFMSSPELQREMNKYGLKAQKRSRTVRLLTHIYNELHPLLPIGEVEEGIAEISSDENEEPPFKKQNINDDSLEKSNSVDDSEDELLCSQNSNESVNSDKETINKEMEFYETEPLQTLENSSDIKEAFIKLINSDKILHNKILQYKPINIEKLYFTLRANGFKCKLSNVMSLLDEQCITFYAPEQCVKNKARRKA